MQSRFYYQVPQTGEYFERDWIETEGRPRLFCGGGVGQAMFVDVDSALRSFSTRDVSGENRPDSFRDLGFHVLVHDMQQSDIRDLHFSDDSRQSVKNERECPREMAYLSNAAARTCGNNGPVRFLDVMSGVRSGSA